MWSPKKLALLVVALLVAAGTATAFAATTSTPKPNKLTGYPRKINTINMAGYHITTAYPLGKLDKGSTYQQTYTKNTVTAVAVKGPYVGSKPSKFHYIAMPIAHNMVLLVWLEPKFKHNTFLFNLNNHLVSVVTWDQKGDPSLGSFTITKAGTQPLP